MNSIKVICLAGLCLLANMCVAKAATNIITRVVTSRHASAPVSTTAAGDSVYPMLTPDGRFVAFMSNAGNLVTNDNNGADFDIFVRDRINRTTVLVSVDASGKGGGNGLSTLGGISADGRYVVFESEASNLVAGDTNRQGDIFIRDLQLGVTRMVSVTTNGVQGNGRSVAPLMTPDGSRILFETGAQNLTPEGRGFGTSLILWDLSNGGLQSITQPLNPLPYPDVGATSPAISADGRVVAFVSESTNLVAGTPFLRSQVFVRDVAAGRTIWASEKAGKLLTETKVNFQAPLLSQDGRKLVFLGRGYTQNGAWLLLHDLVTDITSVVAQDDATIPNLSLATMTPDGGQIVYQVNDQYYLWRVADTNATLITPNRMGVGPSNGRGQNAVISGDGRYVFFTSDATDLVAEPAGEGFQLYRRDLLNGETVCLSKRPDGSPGQDLNEVLPSISADGRWVAFESTDESLAPGDDNDASDVFVRDAETLELVSQRASTLPNLGSGSAYVGYFNRLFPSNEKRSPFDRAGKKFIFMSNAADLSTNDPNPRINLFVHDVETAGNVAVSREPLPFLGGDFGLTADGRFATYESRSVLPQYAPDSVPASVVHDLANGSNRLATVTSGMLNLWDFAIFQPVRLSDDGRYAAFRGTDGYLRRHDLATGEWLQIFRLQSWGAGFAISAKGRFLAGPGNSIFNSGLTIWDGKTQTNGIVISNGRNVFDGHFYGSSIAFKTLGNALTGGITEEFVGYSLITGKTNFSITTKKGNPFQGVNSQAALSENGRFVVFCDDANGRVAGDTNRLADVFVYDVVRGTTALVSANRADGGPGNGPSTFPWISQNGRFVAFLSRATNLTADDTHGKQQVFVRDLWLGKTTLVSRSMTGGGGGNGDVPSAVLSPTGRHVAYTSFATDLAPGDFNGHADIFLAELPDVPLVDTDGDGMDDVWERYFFGDLARDGKGDFDGDGYSDLEEYIQNQDPGQATFVDVDEDSMEDGWERRVFSTLNRDGAGDFDGDSISDVDEFTAGSNPLEYDVVNLLRVQLSANNTVRISWRSQVAERYQVQYKSNLSQQQWQNLGTVIRAAGNQTTFVDAPAATLIRRFYRIMVVP